MEMNMMTFAPIIGVAVVGLIVMAYTMHRDNARYVAELEFFLNQRIISHNRVTASRSVLQTKYEALEGVTFKVQAALEELQKKEAQFEAVELRNQFLEKKNSEIEKLEFEITSIQETLNGDIKKQLSNYIKEVDGISLRLNRATDQFYENTKTYEFIESKKSA